MYIGKAESMESVLEWRVCLERVLAQGACLVGECANGLCKGSLSGRGLGVFAQRVCAQKVFTQRVCVGSILGSGLGERRTGLTPGLLLPCVLLLCCADEALPQGRVESSLSGRQRGPNAP
jgi:hypothetical protein